MIPFYFILFYRVNVISSNLLNSKGVITPANAINLREEKDLLKAPLNYFN